MIRIEQIAIVLTAAAGLLTSWPLRASGMSLWSCGIDPGILLHEEIGEDEHEHDLPLWVDALDCPTTEREILNRPLTFRCAVSPRLSVARVDLFYRAAATGPWVEVEMRKTPKGWYRGKIPASAMTGQGLTFHFEARDGNGKVVVRNGSREIPNVMLLVPFKPIDSRPTDSRSGEDLD
jgi:hypothetical protein